MVKFIKKYREYVVLIAYGIVLGDIIQLIKDVAVEWLMHKRFNQLVQRHTEEIKEINIDAATFDVVSMSGDEKLPENG